MGRYSRRPASPPAPEFRNPEGPGAWREAGPQMQEEIVPSQQMQVFAGQMATVAQGITQIEMSANFLQAVPGCPDDVLEALGQVTENYQDAIDSLGYVLGTLNNWQKGDDD